MKNMYDDYAKYTTCNYPFVWAHRLEFPIIVGSIAIIIVSILPSALVGKLTDSFSSRPGFRVDNLNTSIFFVFTFVSGLVSLFWLSLVSRTLDLRNSMTASKYPIYTIVIIATIFMNVSPFIFSNIFDASFHHVNWILFSPAKGSSEAWGALGLIVYLGGISVAKPYP